MKPISQDRILDLSPAQMLRLPAVAGMTVTCNGGLLWITQEGCVRDDFLSPGDSLRLTSTGVTLVEAIGNTPARFTLRAISAPVHLAAVAQVTTANHGDLTRGADLTARIGTPHGPNQRAELTD